MWNGQHGSNASRIKTDNQQIYAFTRERDNDKVIVITNLSSKPQKFTFAEDINKEESYTNIMTKETKKFSDWLNVYKELKGWDYAVLERVKQ